jgi:predicted dehydrogenase
VVRLGLIGVGRWGRNYVRTIAAMEGAVLAAVATRNPDNAALLPTETRIEADWRAVFADRAIDGVIVATPPHTHREIFVAALEADCPVLIEKPLVARRDELPALYAAAASSRAAIMVDHVHLFHPAFRALKQECARRGGARAIRSSAGNHGPYRRDASVLWDWAPHDVAMALEIAPGAARVVAARCDERRAVEDVVAERLVLTLELTGDVSCEITIGTLDDKHRWFAVDTDEATLIYSDQAPFLRVLEGAATRRDRPKSLIPIQAAMPLGIAVSEFVEAIHTGSGSREGFELGCRVVEIIADCEEFLHG